MPTPTRDMIESRAVEMFLSDNGGQATRPEVNELKETGYWGRAQRSLMQTEQGQYALANQLSREEKARIEQLYRDYESSFTSPKGGASQRKPIVQEAKRMLGAHKRPSKQLRTTYHFRILKVMAKGRKFYRTYNTR